MSLSKRKCLYSNNCLHFLKRAVPLELCKVCGSNIRVIVSNAMNLSICVIELLLSRINQVYY